MKHRFEIIVNISIPIIIGTAIYIIFSPNIYVTKYFWKMIHFPNPFYDIDIMSMPIVIRLMRFYLCDALWTYSLTYSVISIIGKKDVKSIIKGCYISVAFLIVIEVAQIFMVLPGTFDYFDLLIQIITSIVTGIIYNKRRV